MKSKLFFALSAFIFITLFSCKKEEVDPVKFGFWGEAFANRTGSIPDRDEADQTSDLPLKVTTLPSNHCENCFSILFGNHDESTLELESLRFNNVPAELGRYVTIRDTNQVIQMFSTSYDFGTFDGEDIIVHGIYDLLETSENNFIEVTSVEEKRSEIRINGKFGGTYIRNENWLVQDFPPDTIWIENGTFEGRFSK